MRVVSFNIATLDGRIALSPRVPSWLDSRWEPAMARRVEHPVVESATGVTVVLEGSNSFVSREAGPADWDDSAADDLLSDSPVDRTAAPRWMVVPDSRGRVRWRAAREGDTAVLVLVTRTTPTGYLAFLREEGIPYLVAGDSRVDLPTALDRVGAALGVDTVMSTAGGVLNGVLLREGLLSEVAVQFLPVIVGRADAPSIFEGYEFGVDRTPAQLELIETRVLSDGSFLVRYSTARAGP